MRFSIITMLAGVAVVALALAAQLNASALLDRGLSVFVGTALLSAALCAIYRSRFERAFWIGFALFGCLAFFRQEFSVSPFLREIYPYLQSHMTPPAIIKNSPIENPYQAAHVMELSFMQVGQRLFDLAFALMGGMIGQLLYRSGRPARLAETQSSETTVRGPIP